MDGAAGGGHLEMVEWLAKNRREGCSSAAFDMAAAEGHLDIIEVVATSGKYMNDCSSLLRTEVTVQGLLADSVTYSPMLNLFILFFSCLSASLCDLRSEATTYALCLCLLIVYSGGDVLCPPRVKLRQWLSDAGLLRCSSTGLDNAAGGGHVHLLEVVSHL